MVIAQGKPRDLGGLLFFSNLIFLLRTIYFFISPLIHLKNFHKLINIFEEFDHQFFKAYGLEVTKRFWNKGTFWVAIIFLNSFLIISSRIAFHQEIQSIYDIIYETPVYIYSYNFRQIYVYLYLFFCFNTITRFQDFHLEWVTIVNVISKQKNNIQYLEIARHNYFLLCKIVDNLSEYFGYVVSFLYMSTLMDNLLNLFGVPFSSGLSNVYRAIEVTIGSTLLYITSIMAVKIKNEVCFV